MEELVWIASVSGPAGLLVTLLLWSACKETACSVLLSLQCDSEWMTYFWSPSAHTVTAQFSLKIGPLGACKILINPVFPVSTNIDSSMLLLANKYLQDQIHLDFTLMQFLKPEHSDADSPFPMRTSWKITFSVMKPTSKWQKACKIRLVPHWSCFLVITSNIYLPPSRVYWECACNLRNSPYYEIPDNYSTQTLARRANSLLIFVYLYFIPIKCLLGKREADVD